MNTDAEISPTCRAEWSRRVITDLFAVCLCGKSDCQHQIDCAGLRLCFHPNRERIVVQTYVAAIKTSNRGFF
ncbi:MAG TPA: hypothetical protein VLC94_00575 [Candidatus Acidoferrum sp.]|nr:hypothetical protein [Candidatus Acidoferrum sp.]HTL74436.1 hypothetical protein [bacterium]